ncbi:hypothetical protein LEP1GSC034_4077 [Leptospira interrogans str. 2003000735]|uniref:Uncharacterized protein n=12 Tax=Leptospira interrogans TaxID=173 RepID=A0A0E2D4F9_LEPIR|nr:hypothetical protein BRAT_04105 [Leptospira interrogans serovar Bratislava]AKP26947.1 hypothetical protein LIMLP_14060 [Leptospira interrogans serovar Manilae]ALE40782.1 hypothetical protein G436_3634 [Leptospira interrogans serovar Hardjo str. Norma]ALO01606.1 hypothetical protein LIH_14730 [Leptospira interrogans serovar Hardjo-prajitno]EJO79007.1 hypothetical protein LEP1GSC045_3197 [Leptospira interrogans serovar Pomona str. Kennewicki LC82-25]EJP02380.1 hypothetical protein LEP1GSC007_
MNKFLQKIKKNLLKSWFESCLKVRRFKKTIGNKFQKSEYR